MRPTKLLKTGDSCPCCGQPIKTDKPDVLYLLSWINEARRFPATIHELCQVMSDYNEGGGDCIDVEATVHD